MSLDSTYTIYLYVYFCHNTTILLFGQVTKNTLNNNHAQLATFEDTLKYQTNVIHYSVCFHNSSSARMTKALKSG